MTGERANVARPCYANTHSPLRTPAVKFGTSCDGLTTGYQSHPMPLMRAQIQRLSNPDHLWHIGFLAVNVRFSANSHRSTAKENGPRKRTFYHRFSTPPVLLRTIFMVSSTIVALLAFTLSASAGQIQNKNAACTLLRFSAIRAMKPAPDR